MTPLPAKPQDLARNGLPTRPGGDWFSLFNSWKPDPVGQILGTGFFRYTSPFGLDGLAKCDGRRLDLLVLNSSHPGTGQFRAFIAKAKREVETIIVWEVWNPGLPSILLRYGFAPYSERESSGLTLEGFRWDHRPT